jgi:4-diphosphocytidyl-2-C-methyl-D-erythritol kinase
MFTLKAPAKINWFLSVLQKRGDGYHDISSLMQCVDLYDLLTFEKHDTLQVISDVRDLPVEQNLVYRAAMAMRGIAGVRQGAKITLKKEIPLAAGMGGGSSDAACTLIGLNRLWGTNLSTEKLHEVGELIGSDVPFFINSNYAYAEGRGEIITALPGAPAVTLLLVNPGIPVSTAWAYQARQSELTKKAVDIKLFCQTLDRNDFDLLRSLMVNDLEHAVISAFPEIGRIKDSLLRLGAVASSMSGSGSTVFGVFRSTEEAEYAATNIGAAYWRRVVKTLTNHYDQ